MITMKRIFSIILAVFMLLSAIPFTASAADPIALTTSNVTEWPTVTYNNGEAMYFGQSVKDAVTLNGGTVTYNGTVVPGHFEFIDINETPTLVGTQRSNIKFVPDNTDEYTGFEATRNRNVTYVVSKTTPVFVDEVNDPIIATEVEAGATLSTSTLSGGKVTNPYNANEPKLLAASWAWLNSYTIVQESGYYEARFTASGYNQLTAQVYVKIAGEVPETTISEMPVIEPLAYDASITLKDVAIKGGVAVLKNEGTVVEGTFSIAESAKDYPLSVGTYNVPITFTPADPEAALPYTFDISITVTKAPIRFVDENGNEIVPEITVPYGTKFYDVVQLLQPYVKGAEYTALSLGDLEYKQCEDGTFTVTASAPSDGAHYETTELSFKIIIEKKAINPKLYSEPGKLYIEDTSGIYNPTGTFTLEYTIDGVEQTPITGIKYLERFDWNPTQSGDYEYEIIYNEAAEKEYYIINDFTASNAVTLSWGFSATGSLDGEYQYGSEVTLEAPATDPEKDDKPFYGFKGWTDVNGNTGLTEEELKSAEITFTMPDSDVELTANYAFSFLMLLEYIYTTLVNFFASVVNSIATLF